MAFKLAEAFVQLSAKGFSGVDRTIDSVTTRFDRLGAAASRVSSLLPGIGTLLAGLGVTAGVGGMIKMAADAEQTAISFEVLLGSASAARQMIAELNDFAATTPFDFPGLSNAAKTMLSFGIAGDEIVDNIRMISDVAQGDGQKLGSLALVLGQIASAGKLTGGDLLQLVNAGFNPLQVISEKTGISVATLRDKMSEGLITFDMVKEAFRAATSEGGLFYQMNEKQSQTLGGLWSTLSDNVGMGLRNIGQGIVDAFDLKGVLSNAISFTDQFMTAIQPIIADLIPSIQAAMNSLSEVGSSAWATLTGATGTGVDFVISGLQAIGDWTSWLLDTTSFVIDNWRLLWAILLEKTFLFFDNMATRIRTWGINAVEIMRWFGDNWYEILMTTVDAILTIFINLGTNIRMIWQEIVDFIWSMGQDPIEFNFTPMMEGFRNTISEMPELTEAAVQESSEYLDALQSKLAENAQRHFDRPDTKSFAEAAQAAETAARKASPQQANTKTGQAGQMVGISQLAKNIQTSAVKKADQFAQKTAEATQKIASAIGPDGKMKTTSGPATAG